jgi:hypothetical protein
MGNAIIEPMRTVRSKSYTTACIWNRTLDVNRTSGHKVAPTAAAAEISFLRAVTGYWMSDHVGSEDTRE